MRQLLSYLFISLVLLNELCWADVYLHNPRGSNDRLNAENPQRQNANRLFDSQNNAKGGYNVGESTSDRANTESQFYRMLYFQSGANADEETYLPIEWTYQHGCGTDELQCQLVLQMLCQPDVKTTAPVWEIRDGENEGTIRFSNPQNNENEQQRQQRRQNDLNNAREGVHEPWDWYNECYQRERNVNLFTAERRLNTIWLNNAQYSSAIHTRQNNNGNRHGYECPEERDYYPYFGPNPWKDIAILTDNQGGRCPYYRQNSFSGTVSRGVCASADGSRLQVQYRYNNASSCQAAGYAWHQVFNYLEKVTRYTSESSCTAASTDKVTYMWAVPWDATNVVRKECLVQLPTPSCAEGPWSRSNHLGNSRTGEAPRYMWTLPYFPSGTTQRCVLRIRYNISSTDYDPWRTDARRNQPKTEDVRNYYQQLFQTKAQEIRQLRNMSDSAKNAAVIKLEADLKAQANAKLNEFVSPVQTNPKIAVAPGFPAVQFATNADQMGRVFQDRSHVFRLAPRPASARGKKIYNLNVRGKRGNIVQTYPAVEYDFIPNNLQISSSNALVHIQWTGSNRHVGDGEGRQGTDRSNIVQVANFGVNYPLRSPNFTLSMWSGASVVWTQFDMASQFQGIITGATSRRLVAENVLLESAYVKSDSENYLLNRNADNGIQNQPIVDAFTEAQLRRRSDSEAGEGNHVKRLIHRVILSEQNNDDAEAMRKKRETERNYQSSDLMMFSEEDMSTAHRMSGDKRSDEDERNVDLWDWSEKRVDDDNDVSSEKRQDDADAEEPTAGRSRALASPSMNRGLTRSIGPGGLTDENLALAMLTSGYYWCLAGGNCPSYIPRQFVAPATITDNNLNPTLDQAPPSFPGVLLSFSPGSYFYISSRNNKFSNRMQKGRIVVS